MPGVGKLWIWMRLFFAGRCPRTSTATSATTSAPQLWGRWWSLSYIPRKIYFYLHAFARSAAFGFAAFAALVFWCFGAASRFGGDGGLGSRVQDMLHIRSSPVPRNEPASGRLFDVALFVAPTLGEFN